MTDTQEYPWIKHYPEGVPATINPDIYGIAIINMAGMIAKYFAISLAMEKVVRLPRVIRSCLPISTTSRIFVGPYRSCSRALLWDG